MGEQQGQRRPDARRGWLRVLVPILAWTVLALLIAQQPGRAAGVETTSEQGVPAAGPNAATRDARQAVPADPAKREGSPSSADRAVGSPSPSTGARVPLVYVPPARGAARHTAGAGTRGFSPHASGAASRPPTAGTASLPAGAAVRPRVRVLAPLDHVGRTALAAPTLYWFLSAPTTTRVELTVVDDEATDPLVRVVLPGPVDAGLHALSLAERGVVLESGKTYRWFVALVNDVDRRSRDELAEGAIERIAPSAQRPRAPDASTSDGVASRGDAVRLAEQGLWYDAVAALEAAIARAPADTGLRADRTALLSQAAIVLEER